MDIFRELDILHLIDTDGCLWVVMFNSMTVNEKYMNVYASCCYYDPLYDKYCPEKPFFSSAFMEDEQKCKLIKTNAWFETDDIADVRLATENEQKVLRNAIQERFSFYLDNKSFEDIIQENK